MQLIKKLLREFLLLIPLFVLAIVVVKIGIKAYLPGNPEIDIDLGGRRYLFNEITLGIVLFVVLVCVVYSFRFLFFVKSRIHTGIILIAYMLLGHALIWYYAPVYKEVRGMYGNYELTLQLDPGDPHFFERLEESLNIWHETVAREVMYMQLALGVFTFLFVVIFIRTLIKRSRSVEPPAKNEEAVIT